MPAGAPDDGAIVQRLVVDYVDYNEVADLDQTCDEGDSGTVEFWERWSFSDGDKCSDDLAGPFDIWTTGVVRSDATVVFYGEASFYTNAEMAGNGGELFGRGNVPFANRGEATFVQPGFWTEPVRPRLIRKLKFSFDCCEDVAPVEVICSFVGDPEECSL